MEDIIKGIIDKAIEMKNYSNITDLDIAKFIHVELGKIIYYDNNYSSQKEDNEQETQLSLKRKENNGNIKIIKEKIKSNDLISEYIITPSQIGKKSIDANMRMKDIAKGVVDRKIEERTHLQEKNLHNHDKGQGGTNEGRQLFESI